MTISTTTVAGLASTVYDLEAFDAITGEYISHFRDEQISSDFLASGKEAVTLSRATIK